MTPEHKVDQLWQSSDKRHGPVFVIVAVEPTRVQAVNVNGKRHWWIKRSRLKPQTYALLRDA